METIHGLNKNASAIIGTGIAFTILAATAVGLRLYAKRFTKASYGIDDYLLILALLIYMTAEILVVRCMYFDYIVTCFIDRADSQAADIVGRTASSKKDYRYLHYIQVLLPPSV